MDTCCAVVCVVLLFGCNERMKHEPNRTHHNNTSHTSPRIFSKSFLFAFGLILASIEIKPKAKGKRKRASEKEK